MRVLTRRYAGRFRTQIVIACLACVACALTLCIAFAIVFSASAYRAEAFAQYSATVEGTASKAAFALITERDDLRRRWLSSAATDPHMVSSFIITPSGETAALHGVPLSRLGIGAVDLSLADTVSSSVRLPHWVFVAPVYAQSRDETAFDELLSDAQTPRLIGYYGFVVRPDYLASLTARLTGGFLVAAVCILIFTGLAVVAITGRLLQPLARLVATTKRAKRSGYRERASVDGPDEVRVLAKSVNALLSAVFSDTERLEQEVRRRTRKEAEATDIAERKSREAEEAAEGLRRTISVWTHEGATPVRIIRNAVEEIAAERDFLQSETALERIDEQLLTIRPQLSALDDLISRLNLFLEASHGGMAPNAQWTNVPEILNDIAAALAPAARQSSSMLSIDADPVMALIDRSGLHHICHNLLSNACKFTKHGRITLTAYQTTTGLEVTCTDTGTSIARSKQNVIWEPMRQADMSFRRPVGGIGVGLSIVRGYVDLLGGSISLESDSGEGASFTISLPCEVARPRPATPGEGGRLPV